MYSFTSSWLKSVYVQENKHYDAKAVKNQAVLIHALAMLHRMNDMNNGNTNEMKMWPSRFWYQFKQLQIKSEEGISVDVGRATEMIGHWFVHTLSTPPVHPLTTRNGCGDNSKYESVNLYRVCFKETTDK